MESSVEAVALYQKGEEWLQAGNFEAAEACMKQAIALQSLFPQAHAQLGYLLDRRGLAGPAEQHFRQATQLAPALCSAHLNLGALLLQQKRLDEAEACLAQALALDPESSAIWSNLGSLYLASKAEDDAEACLRRAMALDPDNPKPRFNLAYLQLRRGLWAEGWQLFESRDWYAGLAKHFHFPRWQGEPLAGKSLLLCFEAGHGDVIQFCRYATLLRQRGASRLVLLCHPALVGLLQSYADLDQVLSFTEKVPESGFDYWLPLLSAPHFCHTPALPVYAPGRYLQASDALRAHWAPQLPPGNFRVGLVWQGNPAFENDSERSLPGPELLAPLWQLAGVTFISLQKGSGEDAAAAFSAGYPLTCMGPEMRDFADAAAIIDQLDLLISVDTAMAHLCGALGKPCWLLLPEYMTDWRWGAYGSLSAWYPDALRLFRQPASGQWPAVIDALFKALQTCLADQPSN